MHYKRLWLLGLFLAAPLSAAAQGDAVTRVFLNGRPTPVHFNDGDSFRVLAGPFAETRARLSGFNTLESYGPVHRFPGFTAKELYWNAKMATMNARKGEWHCVSKDLKRDTYGRILWFCLDLAVDQVRRGYAHVFTIDEKPGDPRIIRAQEDAQQNKRGMWAHGVPEYVLTSLHSASESSAGRRTYNRVISSRDGHSASQRHENGYTECEWVCLKERQVSETELDAAFERLQAGADPQFKNTLRQLGEGHVRQVVADFARLGWVTNIKNPRTEAKLTEALTTIFPNRDGAKEGSCALYVDYRRRWGKARAKCLK